MSTELANFYMAHFGILTPSEIVCVHHFQILTITVVHCPNLSFDPRAGDKMN